MSPSLNKVASSSSSNSREGKYFVLQDEVDPCTRPGGVVTAGIYAHHACFVLKRTGGGASTSSCKTKYLPLGNLLSQANFQFFITIRIFQKTETNVFNRICVVVMRRSKTDIYNCIEKYQCHAFYFKLGNKGRMWNNLE